MDGSLAVTGQMPITGYEVQWLQRDDEDDGVSDWSDALPRQ